MLGRLVSRSRTVSERIPTHKLRWPSQPKLRRVKAQETLAALSRLIEIIGLATSL
jgi:hypothetical protein